MLLGSEGSVVLGEKTVKAARRWEQPDGGGTPAPPNEGLDLAGPGFNCSLPASV
jgi:hypothetical protein